MKIASTIVKIVIALAAIAGIVFVVATYGSKIVAWAKKLLGKCQCCGGECQCEEILGDAPAVTDADFEG